MDDNRPQENVNPRNRSNSNSSISSFSSGWTDTIPAERSPRDLQRQEQREQENLLPDALQSGDLSTAQHLLSTGAPILRNTPAAILLAPPVQQLPLFQLLAQHGWTPNTPGPYGEVLLHRIVTDRPLLLWFLEHGADPNLGQRPGRDQMCSSVEDSGAALTNAAGAGDLEAVRLLLNAGARAQNGAPLHAAAGACPPGSPSATPPNPLNGEAVTPSREFDESRIPVMALLVERGADVNAVEDRRYILAQYPIVMAVMAGAVERVRWLLAQGADPKLKGNFGNAVSFAKYLGNADMKRVLGISVDDE